MFPFKILEEKYRSIPDNVREAISSTEVNEKLQSIVNKYNLQFDEGEELTKEIGYVMLGLKSSDLFVKNVQRATELDRETAEKIVEEVNELIFKDIKSSLRESSQEIENKSEFDKEDRQEIRDSLMQEIEKTSVSKTQEESKAVFSATNQETITTDLIKKPEQNLQEVYPVKDKKLKTSVISNGTSPEIPTNTETTPQTPEQNPPKSYTIDPYREPIE